MSFDENPYDVLDVERSASAKELKRAFYKKVRSHPPEHDPERYQDVVDAYEMLKEHPRHQSSSRASNRQKREASSQNAERPAQVEQVSQTERRTGEYGYGKADLESEKQTDDADPSTRTFFAVVILLVLALIMLLILAL